MLLKSNDIQIHFQLCFLGGMSEIKLIFVHIPLSPQEVLWRRLQKTLQKISKYRSFNKLRYFCFILTCFFRVRKEGAETPKILSYGYNLVTKR